MRRQRGVALLLAVLAVALAVLLAVELLDRGEQGRARLRDQTRAEQAWQLMEGMEAWAAEILRAHGQRSAVDTLGDGWRQPMPPQAVPGAVLGGQLRDLGGCFDVNSLVVGGVADERAVQRFARLLRTLRLPPSLAEEAADWIDADTAPRTGGAEDAHYLGAGHRAANTPVVHPGELRRLRSMDPRSWELLSPYLCALPTPAGINLNTAPWPLWTTLAEGIDEPTARRLAREPGTAYASLEGLQLALEREGIAAELSGYTLRSRYFLAEAEIEADGIAFLHTSLLAREGLDVRVLARVRGRW